MKFGHRYLCQFIDICGSNTTALFSRLCLKLFPIKKNPFTKMCTGQRFKYSIFCPKCFNNDLATWVEIKIDKLHLIFFGNVRVGQIREARYLTGENLKVVWAKFSTLSQVILLYCALSAWHDMQPLLQLKTRPRVRSVS